ncbi:S-phase kinase-associated protein 1 [Nematocida ausubeli]|nr:S-phase kinase-associated protein 1 [Nematocida ausubeli]KAI5134262.1 S-phase kinase-associated protein 1 [Nematocida ausubeli]KAI5139850.1 S-phase kinase-associated protein 1 [Nematocida ausubeli]KAI5152117.1 S-phase kinase-associated protein 1 [Nematocida ausubeli]
MKVISQEGTTFILPKKHYKQSKLLLDLEKETKIPKEGISLLVDNLTLKKVIEFMEGHENDLTFNEEISEVILTDFDEEFLNMEIPLLFKVTAAANYLNIPLLLEICCKNISKNLQNKNSKEIVKYLKITENMKNEVNVEKEYKWIE